MIWTAACDPAVLRVSATPRRAGSFDLDRHPHRAVVDADGAEHIVLDLCESKVRLDVIDGSLLHGPVDLIAHLPVGGIPAPQLIALDRLMHAIDPRIALYRRRLPADRRFARLVEALRVADALAARASLSEIASALFASSQRSTFEWPGPGEHLRSSVRRKVALARRLINLGPAGVLQRRT